LNSGSVTRFCLAPVPFARAAGEALHPCTIRLCPRPQAGPTKLA
jgi:hypothetical protein